MSIKRFVLISRLSLSFLFQAVYAWLTLMHSATLKIQTFPVGLDELLRRVARCFGHAISSRISVPTDYVTNAFLCVSTADNVIDNIVGRAPRQLLWRPWPSGRRVVILLAALGVYVPPCTFGVDYSTGGARFSLGAAVARYIDITFSIPSSSIIIFYDVVLVALNARAAFGSSFERSSSYIRLAVVFIVSRWSTYTQSLGRNIGNFCTDWCKYFLYRVWVVLSVLLVFVHMDDSQCSIRRWSSFTGIFWDAWWSKAVDVTNVNYE